MVGEREEKERGRVKGVKGREGGELRGGEGRE